VPEEPGLADVLAEQRELLSRLRAVVEAKDAENQVLRAGLDAARERERRLELRLAELDRRLRIDSTDSGTPTSCWQLAPRLGFGTKRPPVQIRPPRPGQRACDAEAPADNQCCM
jgi:hypothetical protein